MVESRKEAGWILALLLTMGDNMMSRRVGRSSKRRFLKWYGSGRYRLLNYIGSVVLIVPLGRLKVAITFGDEKLTHFDRA